MERFIILIIVGFAMIISWVIGQKMGWTQGFNDGIKFRNKQLEDNNLPRVIILSPEETKKNEDIVNNLNPNPPEIKN